MPRAHTKQGSPSVPMACVVSAQLVGSSPGLQAGLGLSHIHVPRGNKGAEPAPMRGCFRPKLSEYLKEGVLSNPGGQLSAGSVRETCRYCPSKSRALADGNHWSSPSQQSRYVCTRESQKAPSGYLSKELIHNFSM